jgi:hypothetical protein
MARIEGEVLIRRPVEDVFDFVAEERSEPIFNHNMLSSEKVTDGADRGGHPVPGRHPSWSQGAAHGHRVHRVRPASPDRLQHAHVHRGLQRHPDLHRDSLRHETAVVLANAAEGRRPACGPTARQGRRPAGTPDVDPAARPSRSRKPRPRRRRTTPRAQGSPGHRHARRHRRRHAKQSACGLCRRTNPSCREVARRASRKRSGQRERKRRRACLPLTRGAARKGGLSHGDRPTEFWSHFHQEARAVADPSPAQLRSEMRVTRFAPRDEASGRNMKHIAMRNRHLRL